MNVTVRGRSVSSNGRATGVSACKRLLVFFSDILFAIVLTEITYAYGGFSKTAGIPLVPGPKLFIILSFFWLFPLILGKFRLMLSSAPALSTTVGEWMWGIQRSGENRVAYNADENSGIFLTCCLLVVLVSVFEFRISKTPEWMTGSTLSIEAALPPADWRVLAFHYSLAAWPKPEGYYMPYEFGPPKRFVGKVEARWGQNAGFAGLSEEKLVFEGPKTPFPFQNEDVTREQLKQCMIGSSSFRCAAIRELSLERPLAEMRALGFGKFKLKWFTAVNPVIPEDERAQGILLSGVAGKETPRYEDRYILVSKKGMQQALIFSYLNSDSPEKVRIALGTLRFSDDLNPGRAWVDRELESIQLGSLPPASDPGYLPKLIEAEGLLVSKISVEPGPIETYFHLAGIQAMLLEYGKKNHRADIVDDAKQMLDQVHHFAMDIASQYPANSPAARQSHEIEKLWHESLQF
jgi:hypothetical protein